jgi:hypothetical protein
MCESAAGGVGSAARKNGKRRRVEESRRERHSKEFTLSARVHRVSSVVPFLLNLDSPILT